MKKTVLVIDTSSMLHQVAGHLRGLETSTGIPTGHVYNFVSKVAATHVFMADEVIFTLDSGHGGRDEESGNYKANRGNERNNYANLILPFLKNINCKILIKEGFEADDVIYTVCKNLSRDKSVEQIIVLSKDYDLSYTLVFDKVRHFMTTSMEVSDTALFLRFGCYPQTLPLYKAIFGDASDNIKPIKGLKKKELQNLFIVCKDRREILKTFPKNKEQLAQLLSNLRLVRMKQLKGVGETIGTFDSSKLKAYFDTYELSTKPESFLFMKGVL